MTPTGKIIALGAGGGGAVLAVVITLVVVVRALTRDETKPAATATSTATQLANEGMRAPGAAELRALGCDQALIVDMQRVMGAGRIREGEPRYMVTCDVASGKSPPTCEKAASVYFQASSGQTDAAVNVRVSRQGTDKPLCSRLFAPNGSDLGQFPRL